MKTLTKFIWLGLTLITGAAIWLALVGVLNLIFPLATWIPVSYTTPISLLLLVLLLGLPAVLSAAASTRIWRKRFCRFGRWFGLVPPLVLTLALLLVAEQGFSRGEAFLAIILSFLFGLIAAHYTDRVCSLNQPDSPALK
jgi:hypothetical protein